MTTSRSRRPAPEPVEPEEPVGDEADYAPQYKIEPTERPELFLTPGDRITLKLGTTITYRGKDGRQYVAVVAAAPGGPLGPDGKPANAESLIAFALPK